MTRAALFGLAAIVGGVAVGCGGGGSVVRDEDGPDPEPRVARAAEAWAALDPRAAARAADEAITLGAGEEASEIAARAHLAMGRTDAAIRALEGVSTPTLLRLRARAQILALDLEGALASLDVASQRAREEDPWTEAVRPALRATLERGAPYEVTGDAAAVPLEEVPLPVVRVRVDAVETLALVGAGTDLVVLDPSVRHDPGAIDELTVGSLRVRNVPHISRSLEAVRETLGVEIGMVIGAHLLQLLNAVLDGPGAELRLSAVETPPSDGASRARAFMLTGSFMAIEARLGTAPAWLTVDTAGLFPIALTPGTDEALGIPEDEWRQTNTGPALWIAPSIRLGSLQVDRVPLVRGLLGEDHARAVGAPIAGSIGWALLGQLVTRFGRGHALYFQ